MDLGFRVEDLVPRTCPRVVEGTIMGLKQF